MATSTSIGLVTGNHQICPSTKLILIPVSDLFMNSDTNLWSIERPTDGIEVETGIYERLGQVAKMVRPRYIVDFDPIA